MFLAIKLGKYREENEKRDRTRDIVDSAARLATAMNNSWTTFPHTDSNALLRTWQDTGKCVIRIFSFSFLTLIHYLSFCVCLLVWLTWYSSAIAGCHWRRLRLPDASFCLKMLFALSVQSIYLMLRNNNWRVIKPQYFWIKIYYFLQYKFMSMP